MSIIHRNLEEKLKKTINSFSAVYISGARQCGKSTLAQYLSADNANYMTFDTTTVKAAAKNDPDAFISGLPKDRLNIIDEVQRVPAVHLAIKKMIDESRVEGRNTALFLLTGSANIFGLPKLAKAMVGRMANLTLYPFSASEISKTDVNFIQKLWNDDFFAKKYERADIVSIIKDATFPEIALNKNINRSLWYDSYLSTILERDAVEFAGIRKPEIIYQLLVSLTGRVGSLLNNDNIMNETGLNQGTYEKYKSFCNAVSFTFEIPSWTKLNKLNMRFVKRKKIYFTDTNFLCFLMRRDLHEAYNNDPSLMGHIFENFAASEIMKAISALPEKYYVSHFNPVRADGKETDFVIEKDNGETIAMEIKLDSSLNAKDFKNLELCRDAIGGNFNKGIVLYTGEDLVRFSDRLYAVPVNFLWE